MNIILYNFYKRQLPLSTEPVKINNSNLYQENDRNVVIFKQMLKFCPVQCLNLYGNIP